MPRLGHILARRSLWADRRSWMLGEYHRMLRRFRGLPLPGHGNVVRVRPAGLEGPLDARLGTSDFLVIFDLLAPNANIAGGASDGRGEYDAAIDAAARAAGGRDSVRLVVDLGANIGVATALFARSFPRATLVGVEPDAGNFALLQRNTSNRRANGPTITCVRACIGATRRTVSLDRSAHGGEPWAIAMTDAPASSSTDQVETLTMADLPLGEHPIDLLKCDIEGAERELFESCAGWIRRVRVMVVELHAPYRLEAFLQHLRSAESGRSAFSTRMLREDAAIQVVLLERTDA